MKEQIKAIRSIRAEISAIQKQTLEMIRLLEDQGILEPMQKPQTKKEKALKMGFAVVQMRLTAHQPAPDSTRAPSMARAWFQKS
ncbi:MAG: hypothetical protein BWX58_01296 [Deltaproteobacteria bacterium ADurb.Bin026]|nr:MAG: hypothetical protein BWX58_01296 [Deltaproteobacteria bacterium ADurb.Bin026]